MAIPSAAAFPGLPNEMRPVEDDDVLWTEYLKEAANADARLVKDWTKVIDVLLVFVTLFSGVLTAFIIKVSDNLNTPPAEVTNKILIAIYNRTMNASMPIDLEQFLRLDESTRRRHDYQIWLLYTSLIISVGVAAIAMAAKLWVIRYSREVATSGPPRACVKRRQEVYDGLVAWKLDKCIDFMPILALGTVILFGFFLGSSVSEHPSLSYFVGVSLVLIIAIILIASFSAAFDSTSPYRSLFSDIVNLGFRIFPDKRIVIKSRKFRWRTIGVIFSSIAALAGGGYLTFKQYDSFIAPVFYAIAAVFALICKEEEIHMRPRLVTLPLYIIISSIFVSLSFTFACYSSSLSTPGFLFCWIFASTLLCLQGFLSIKLSKTRPKTIEAEAVSWLLKTSSNKKPAWFQKAVQIAEQSPNARGLVAETLLPILVPLITPQTGQQAVTPEQEGYIRALATLMDFEPQAKHFRRNEASIERPTFPQKLIDRLEQLQASRARCSHGGQQVWVGGAARCPEVCVSNAVEHILRLHKLQRG